MTIKREPVAFDFVDLSGAATGDDRSAPLLVRRPIPSVPHYRPVGAGGGAAGAQAMSRMASPAPDQGFQGVSRPPWVNIQVMAGSEENSSITIDSSLKKAVTEGPSASAWDRSAPASPSYHSGSSALIRQEDSALAQQARKTASMNGLRQQPWSRPPVAARAQSDKENSGKVVVTPKKETESMDGPPPGHHLSLPAWDSSSPASALHHHAGSAGQHEEYVRMQQARMVAAMNAGRRQASRGVYNPGARIASFRDEAQRGAQPSDRTGTEHLATQPHPPGNHRRFGSPAGFYARMRLASAEHEAAMADMRPPFQQHPLPAGNAPRPGGSAGNQPQTGQLTIFYYGTVNVYDEVPVEKAQAIMLLAGSGNIWPPNNMSRPGTSAPGRPFSAPAAPPPTQSTPGSPAPHAPTTSAAGPPRSLAPGMVFSNRGQQPALPSVELPQARKASLARFLEKRKDRVRKAPVKIEGEPSPSRDKSPSPSPAPAGHDCKSSPGASRHPPSASCCNEPNSPSRPPQTPPRPSVCEEKNAGTVPNKRPAYETGHEDNKRSRSGRAATTHAVEDNSAVV